MTYDNTDSDSDGVIDAPVDNESVSTDETHYTDRDSAPTEDEMTVGVYAQDGRLYFRSDY